MKDVTKHYSNADITVVWKPSLCAHSTLCWKGLSSVFNPRMRPWIRIDGAWTEEIIAQVEKCPSGALSYYRNDKPLLPDEKDEAETTIQVSKNGPLMVYGNVCVKHADGTESKNKRVTAFCRCGHSGNKPFCDGTHVKIGFKDE